jgi:hypothetical protein
MKILNFVENLRTASLSVRTLYVQSPVMVVARVSSLVRKKLSRGTSAIRRRAMTGQIRVVKTLFGAKAANAYFWRSFTTVKTWPNVEKRLYNLENDRQAVIRHFVAMAFAHAQDPMVLIGLAHNPLSRQELASLLNGTSLDEGGTVFEKIKRSRDYASAYAGISLLLLSDETGAEIVSKINAIHMSFRGRHFHILDSLSARPAFPPSDINLRSVQHSGLRKPASHRLIIVETLADRRAIAQLFGGAEKITILGLSDLLGKADFSEFVASSECETIDVEHIRSRNTRFSRNYHRIHETTRRTAEQIIQGLVQESTTSGVSIHAAQPYMESHLADQLFFQLLKLEALKILLEDKSFDHIVIATQNQAITSSYYQIMSGIEALKKDPRVEIISISRSMNTRANFGTCVRAIIKKPIRPESFRSWELPLEKILLDLDREAAGRARNLSGFSEDSRQKVMLVTAANPAYNSSTAHFARTVGENYNTKVAFIGTRGNDLLRAYHRHIQDLDTTAPKLDIQPVPSQFGKSFSSLNSWLREYLLEVIEHVEDPGMAHILAIFRSSIAQAAIVNGLATFSLCKTWLSNLRDENMLPELFILTPVRIPSVAAFAALAREFNIPSIALEPHGLNADYCRYTKVTADYYGVTSCYFKDEKVLGFDIPAERIRVIGTPRIIAPADYSREIAHQQAREEIQKEFGIEFTADRHYVTFFCQPSDWKHMEKVWRIIIKATQGLNISILLKTHPEETPTRIALYLSVASELGASDRVHHMETNPKVVIEASDLLLTGYSVAAIDAAVLECPVFCVTDGNNDYPLPQHDIIGAPLFRTVRELHDGLKDLIANPERYQQSIEAFFAKEPQFVDGPDRYLDALIKETISRPKSETIRPAEAVAGNLFLDGPHKVYRV